MTTSVSLPRSCLKKRYNTLAYHCCRETAAAGKMDYLHYHSDINKSDFLTKALGLVLFLQNTSLPHLWPSHHIENDGEMQEEIPSDSDVVTITENAELGVLIDHSHDGVDLVEVVQDWCSVIFVNLNSRRVITRPKSEDTFQSSYPQHKSGVIGFGSSYISHIL